VKIPILMMLSYVKYILKINPAVWAGADLPLG